MKTLLQRWSTPIFVVVTFTVLAAGCIIPGNGYEDDDGGVYYEPYGVYYGDWGPSYHVGPYRHGGDHGPSGHGPLGHAPAHAFRSAPASHGTPSLPSGARSGGHR